VRSRRRWPRWSVSTPAAGNAVTVSPRRVPDPSGYGRIIRDDGRLTGRDSGGGRRTRRAGPRRRDQSGCYAFGRRPMADAVKRVATGNAQGQEYLTDVVGSCAATATWVDGPADEAAESRAVNDRVSLRPGAARLANGRLLEDWIGRYARSWIIRRPGWTWGRDAGAGRGDSPGTPLEGRTDIGLAAPDRPDALPPGTSVGQGRDRPVQRLEQRRKDRQGARGGAGRQAATRHQETALGAQSAPTSR